MKIIKLIFPMNNVRLLLSVILLASLKVGETFQSKFPNHPLPKNPVFITLTCSQLKVWKVITVLNKNAIIPLH